MDNAATDPPVDASRGPLLLGVSWASTVLTLACLSLRLYTRFRIVKAPGFDDLVLIFTMFALLIPGLMLVSVAVKYGLGRHARYLSEHELLIAERLLLAGEAFGGLMSSVPKLAAVIFLQECLQGSRRKSIYALYTLTVVLIILTAVNNFLFFFQCRPLRAFWNIGDKMTCWDPRVALIYAIVISALSAFSDLVLALYPLTFVPRLQMRLKMKIASCCVMGLGVFACACAVVRSQELRISSSVDKDLTWDVVTQIIVSTVETNVIVICASVPAIVPLFLARKKLNRGSTEESTNRSEDVTDDLDTSSRDNEQISYRASDTVAEAEMGRSLWKPSDRHLTVKAEVSSSHG